MIDRLLCRAAFLAEQATLAYLWLIPEVRGILERPASQEESDRAAQLNRIEAALLAASWWAPHHEALPFAQQAWREVEILRWRLVRTLRLRPMQDLALYRAAGLYDGSVKFSTYAKHRIQKDEQERKRLLYGPVRIPRHQADAGNYAQYGEDKECGRVARIEDGHFGLIQEQVDVIVMRGDGIPVAVVAARLAVSEAKVRCLFRQAMAFLGGR